MPEGNIFLGDVAVAKVLAVLLAEALTAGPSLSRIVWRHWSSWYRTDLTTLSRVNRSINVFNKPILVLIRLRSSSMSSGFQLSLFHTLLILLPTLPVSELSSVFLSSIRCNSSRTFRQPLSMYSKSLFWSLLSSRFEKATSASWRTMQRLLTLFDHNSQQRSKFYLGNILI